MSIAVVFGLIAFAGVFLFFLGISQMRRSAGGSEDFQARLAAYGVTTAGAAALPQTAGFRDSLNRLFQPAADRVGRGDAKKGKPSVAEQLQRADLKLRPSEYFMIQIGTGLLVGLIGYWRWGLVFALLFFAGYLIPGFYVKYRVSQRLKKFNTQLGDTLTLLSNALKAGYSFAQAIDTVAKNATAPIGDEFARAVREMNLGGSPDEALSNITKRIASADFDLVATAYSIHRTVGGNLAEILDNIAYTIRERVRIKGEIQTLTAQARASGTIITALPILLATFMFFVTPTYFQPMFGSIIGWILLAIGVFMIFIGLARTPSSNTALTVQQRLSVYGGEKQLTVEEIELQRPFSERVLRPGIERLGSLLSRSTPQKARQDLLNRLELAGRPGNLTPEDFAAVRLVAAAIVGALGLLIGLLLANPVYLVIALVVGVILGYYLPVLWLKQKVDARKAEIQKALPDALDLLVICVDAGLGFDAALARVTDKYRNALSDLLSKALREVSLGRPRLEALDEMGRNSGVEDLHNFMQAVIQSEQFGTGIGKILRIQADEMRRKRRQRAQEKGAQATLKMMLPMVGCIFPTLWIVLLGPAVLILMRPRG